MNYKVMQETRKVEVEFEDAPFMKQVRDPEEFGEDTVFDLSPTGALISFRSADSAQRVVVTLFGNAYDAHEDDHFRAALLYKEEQLPDWLKPVVNDLRK